jgi:hypothetical protein
MEVLSQEVVTFGDMYCQMHDLVRSVSQFLHAFRNYSSVYLDQSLP